MSVISDIRGRFDTYSKLLREKILGVNNERLDFLMDSFYKLDHGYRNAVLAGVVGLVTGLVTVAVFVYYMQVSALGNDLNDAFNALNELKALKAEAVLESSRFDQLVARVSNRTRSVTFKPFFERLARQSKIPLKSISDRQPEMDANNPLAEKLREVHIDLRLSKVSIPRLLNFLVDVEKANHYLRVQNLKITGIYGNKLYFDADILIRGYKVVN